jgi:hypothetical protein
MLLIAIEGVVSALRLSRSRASYIAMESAGLSIRRFDIKAHTRRHVTQITALPGAC